MCTVYICILYTEIIIDHTSLWGPAGLSFCHFDPQQVAEMCFTIPSHGEDKRLSTKIMRQGLHHLQQSLASKAERSRGEVAASYGQREELEKAWWFLDV